MSERRYRDAYGIPHLRADDHVSLAFAQGRVTALDRAWQIEVERHRSQGTSASFLGAEAVAWDYFARRARLDDTARRCHAALDPATAQWMGRYVDGVNATLAVGAARAPEFSATGLRPGRWQPWTPLGVWLSHHVLFAGFGTKLWRDHVARRLGPQATGLFAADSHVTSGSNGWLLSAERTAAGAALIAGDPHRFIEAPGIYQQIRLACPEYDVLGFAVPGVPGIPHFGHAGGVAWAITNAMADYQDGYAERLRRQGDRVEAYGPEGWRPAHRHVETIEVTGADAVEVEVIETERGPLVSGGPDDDPAVTLSLRYPPRVLGELGFGVLPALLRARTVGDVDAALDGWVEPVNVVLAADTAGGLLHRVAGRVPRRHPDNALRMVPGWAADHTWQGWHPMPKTPVDQVAVMANDRGIAAALGVEFAPPYRADRIRELLDTAGDWRSEQLAAVHADTYLAAAAPLLELLAAPDGLGPAAVGLRERLLAWDRRMATDSVDAASFADLRAAVTRRLAAHPAFAALTEPSAHPEVFRPWLALLPRIGYAVVPLLHADLPGLDRAEVLREALEEVAADGDNRRWGERHRLVPWQALPDPAAPPGPQLSGDHDCVLATSSVPGVTDLCLRGPAARYVWDLAERADSRWVVPLGATGAGPHHADQLPLWVQGDLIQATCDWDRLTEEHDD
ncbi:penicillin acylase family protein [Micromonospora sp. LOL_024]|uniref:penicillin acylase family protein n=1 Tax=Micromonospora sp. LOL_024 TaxID=3345412 RepID=UPI003A883EF8